MNKQRSLKSVWFFSYLLTISIPIIVTIFIFFIYNGHLIKYNEELNQHSQEIMMQDVNDILSSVRRISSSMIINPTLNYVSKIEHSSKYFTDTDSQNICSVLTEYSNSFSSSSQIYLYICNTDYVFSKSGILDSKRYYNTFFANSSYTYEQWKKYMNSSDFESEHLIYNNDNRKVISYMFTIKKSNGNLILFIETPESSYFPFNEKISWLDKSDSYIFDVDGNLILNSTRSKNNIDFVPTLETLATHKKGYGILVSDIETTGWSLITVIQENAHKKMIDVLKLITMFLVVISILLSIILLYFKTSKNSKPISEIMKALDKSSSILDYKNLATSISELITMNEQFSSEVEKQQNELKNIIFSNLLNGRIDSNTDFLLSNHNINFLHKNFVVAVINSSNRIIDTPLCSKLKYSISLFAENDVTVNFHQTYFNLTAIFNYDNSDTSFYDNLKSAFCELDSLCNSFDTEIKIAISLPHEGYIGITKCYFEAMEIISRSENISEKFTVKFYCDLEENKYKLLSLHQESTFLNNIKNHDFEKSRKNLSNIFNELNNISSSSARSIYIYDLICMVLKLSQIIVIPKNSKISSLIDFTTLLNISSDIQKFKETIFAIIDEVEFADNAQTNTNNNILSQRILELVHENYGNIILSPDLISTHMGLSTKYLNTVFQNVHNISIHSYINKYRMEQAAKLLSQEPQTKIKDIYESVGYNNARTFNRIFKSYYNMTPVEYRDTVIKNTL